MRLARNKWLLLIIGTLVWSLTMIKSGIVYEYGMGFWGPNGHDGVWHVSLINSLSRGSFEMPIFSGQQITNYHIGFDLVLGIIKRLTGIPAQNLYFQIVPPLLAIGIGLAVYKFVLNWKNSASAAWWSTFFVYFGVSAGWLINFLRVGDLGGESMFWSQQSISTLINPPFALSLFVIFLGLNLLQQKKFWSSVIVLALLSQIKIYAAVLLFAAWLFAAVWKKDKWLFRGWLVSLGLSLAIYLPLNKNSAGVLVWQPGWFLETMMAVSDRVNWPRFFEAMINYKQAGNWPKLIAAYSVAFAVFVIGNSSTRLLALFKISFRDAFTLLFWAMIAAGFVLPMVFLQTGTPWNTIQFTYYSLTFMGILAGIALSEVKNPIFNLVVLASSALGIMGTLPHYLPTRPPAQISSRELEALDFLAKQETGVVLTVPFDRSAADMAITNPPRPLYLYESTAYVSAFGDKPVYLEDEVNLNITGYDWKARRSEVESVFASRDSSYIKDFWRGNNISYVYFLPDVRFAFGESELGVQKIFDNGQFMIWKVD